MNIYIYKHVYMVDFIGFAGDSLAGFYSDMGKKIQGLAKMRMGA